MPSPSISDYHLLIAMGIIGAVLSFGVQLIRAEPAHVICGFTCVGAVLGALLPVIVLYLLSGD